MKCKNCGEEISATDLTCPRCRYFVESQEQPMQPQKAQASRDTRRRASNTWRVVVIILIVLCALLLWPLLLVLLVIGVPIFVVLVIVGTTIEWLVTRRSNGSARITIARAFRRVLPLVFVWTFVLVSIRTFVIDQTSMAEYYRDQWVAYVGVLAGILACGIAFRYQRGASSTERSTFYPLIVKVGMGLGAITIIVNGYDIVVNGFPYPYTHSDYQSPRDEMLNNLENIGATAYQYRLRPKDNSGEGSETYVGFKIPSRLDSSDRAYYFIEAVERDSLRITAISTAKKDTARLILDQDGWIVLGPLFYGESASESDKQDAHLWYLSRQAVAYRARQASERGRASYVGLALSKNEASTETGTFKVYVHNDRFVEFGAEPGHWYSSNRFMLDDKAGLRFILDDKGRLRSWTNFRNVDDILSPLVVLRDHAKAYINRPVSEQGGGGSLGGYQIPQNLTEDLNARYHAVIHSDYIEFIALARQRRDTVISILNIDGTAQPISYGWDFDAQR